MENNNLLPLGTVVLLKGATRKIVIIGYYPQEEGNDKIWDYFGCAYPMGVIASNQSLLFDTVQIEKVIYMGYCDNENEEFRRELLKYMRKEN